jgi:hypothetical protein
VDLPASQCPASLSAQVRVQFTFKFKFKLAPQLEATSVSARGPAASSGHSGWQKSLSPLNAGCAHWQLEKGPPARGSTGPATHFDQPANRAGAWGRPQ